MGEKMVALKKEAPLRAPKVKAFHLQKSGLAQYHHFSPRKSKKL
jgi:hypothetical protein